MANTPKIRFKGFTDDWEQRKLIDYLEVSKLKNKDGAFGKEDVLSVSGDYGVVNQIEFQGRSFAGVSVAPYGVVDTGDVIYTKSPLKSNPYGIIKTNKGKPGIVSTLYAVYKPLDNVYSEFVQIYFEQDARMNNYMHPLVNKGAKNDMKVSDENALKGEVCFPSRDEQIKIGEFFDGLDNLITLHQRKYNNTILPFKVWEQRKLGEISNKVTKKNQDAVVDEVFTNSAEFGIISQRDFFDKDIANAENINGYYVVEPDDFVYNPRISTTAPFGPIKRNKLERTGAMSPLYYVFKPHDVDLRYLEWFFQTTCWHAFMRFNGNSGARSDRFAITDKIFNEMPISMPQDIEEQKKIGVFLSEVESIITLHQRKCDELVELKKYMLQNMFPQKG